MIFFNYFTEIKKKMELYIFRHILLDNFINLLGIKFGNFYYFFIILIGIKFFKDIFHS